MCYTHTEQFRTILCTLLLMGGIIAIVGCDATDLNVDNPNEPTPNVLETESGIERLSRGFYESLDLNPPKQFAWITQAHHALMGDVLSSHWGNWQFRWVSQVTSVTLDDGSQWTPPDGGPQPQEILRINDRELDTDAAVVQEWGAMYFLNNQSNLLLESLEGNVIFEGAADAKREGYRAWAHFWKGYAYARIGSMYERGLILDTFGQTTGDYVDRTAIITESNRQFDLAIENAGGFNAVRDAVVPDLFVDSEVDKPTSESLVQAANTLKARNLLVNTRKEDLTESDWQTILDLTDSGLGSNANTFILRSDNVTFPDFWWITNAAWGPTQWHRVSERLIQDIQPGDERLSSFTQSTDENGGPQSWFTRGRGIQYNSSWRIARTGSRYATETSTESRIKWYFVSYEENQLMRAEALLETGDAPGAATLIDEVRSLQNAGLPPVDDSDAENVSEQLRSERRIGLFLRGLSFYDARRWGVVDPVEEGGGRAGAVVIENDGTINTDATINYNYRPYWPTPDEELTFNEPSGDSTPQTQAKK
jgi:hypothetical protein